LGLRNCDGTNSHGHGRGRVNGWREEACGGHGRTQEAVESLGVEEDGATIREDEEIITRLPYSRIFAKRAGHTGVAVGNGGFFDHKDIRGRELGTVIAIAENASKEEGEEDVKGFAGGFNMTGFGHRLNVTQKNDLCK